MKLNINGININYQIMGQGKPIFIIHGYSVDHQIMSGCMEPLFTPDDQYKRIYIDLPGMGESESDLFAANSDSILIILMEFINKIIPDENFLLVGESYGGYLSRGLLSKMSERIDGVMLLCPSITTNMSTQDLPEHQVLFEDAALISELSDEIKDGFCGITVVQSRQVFERHQSEIMAGIKKGNLEFLEQLRKGYVFTFDLEENSKVFEKPSLFLMAKQDSIVGYTDAWEVLKLFPRASFVVLDRAGHNLQIEQPELFAALTTEWLFRVEESLNLNQKE